MFEAGTVVVMPFPFSDASATKRRPVLMLTQPDHVNPAGAVHGGVLMTFADHVLGLYVWAVSKGAPNVTIQLNTHFLAAVAPGDFVVLRGQVTRGAKSLVFVRALLSVDERDVVAADGIWRVFPAP